MSRVCNALLIEPDEGYQAAMNACLHLVGCEVETVNDPRQALVALEQHPFDVVVSGVSCQEDPVGGNLIAEIRVRSQAPIVLVHDQDKLVPEGLESGADRWIPKPFIPSVLIASVRAASFRASMTSLSTRP